MLQILIKITFHIKNRKIFKKQKMFSNQYMSKRNKRTKRQRSKKKKLSQRTRRKIMKYKIKQNLQRLSKLK